MHLNWIGLFFVFLLLVLFFLKFTSSPNEHVVLLSFDVEPVDGDFVLQIADILRAHEINATFFVTGDYAKQYPAIVSQLSDFDIGCHSTTHPVLTKLTDKEQFEELSECKSIVESVLGREITGFRAPYLRLNHATFQVLQEAGYRYDASIPSGLSMFYPEPTEALGEIPVSTFLGIPLMDIYFLYYTNTPKIFFYLLEHKNTGINSFLFHSHHVVNYKGQLDRAISNLKAKNAIFISHSELIKSYEGG